MVKQTQTFRRQIADDCLIVFDHFVGLALKGLKFNPDMRISSILHLHAQNMLHSKNLSMLSKNKFQTFSI